MKITTKKYAEALLESLERKSEKEAKPIIARLFELVVKSGGLREVNKLIEDFIDLWNKKNNFSVVEVATAKKIAQDDKKTIKKYIAKKLGAKDIELKEKIDKNILGGIVIREGDKIFDGSLRTRLYDLKEKIAK